MLILILTGNKMEDLIRKLCLRISLKYSKNIPENNKQLKSLLKFVQNNDIFKGKRKKLYKIIKKFKK